MTSDDEIAAQIELAEKKCICARIFHRRRFASRMIAAKLARMDLLRRILLIALALCSRGQAADDWQLYRHEGRDYVPLDNIARFYGFPPPPALQIPSTPPAAAVAPTPQSGENQDQDGESNEKSASPPASASAAIAN